MNNCLSILVIIMLFFSLLQSPNEEEMSEGEGDSAREHEDADSCDELRRHGNMLADHGDVLAKLKMQVRDIKVRVSITPFLFFVVLLYNMLHGTEASD